MFRKPHFFLLILLFSCSFYFTNTLTAQTTYTTGDVIPTLPSSGTWFPSLLSGGSVISQGGVTTITLRADGLLIYNGITYSSASGCTIVGNRVTSGSVTASDPRRIPSQDTPTTAIEDVNIPLYWTDYGTDKIQRANLDGSVEDLVTRGLTSPNGIALDVSGGKMYWTDYGTDKIQRADLDGSNIEDLVTRGLEYPSYIALDVSGGKMYWTDADTNKIQRADLDGSNIEDLVTRGLDAPIGLALDVSGGKMYWIDEGTDKIQRADLDGSNIEDLVTRGLRAPWGIALDVAGGKMYWTDWITEKIQRANLDGSDVEDLITNGLDAPGAIALDIANGKMYWTHTDWNAATQAFTNGKIQRANLDGTEVQDIITGLDVPDGIALGIPEPADPLPDNVVKADVNADGVVNILDLVLVADSFGQTGTNPADVNSDGVVNIQDLVLVAGAFGEDGAAAPSLGTQVQPLFTASQLEQWLIEAKTSPNMSLTYQRGIAVLEQLLATLILKETALLMNYPNPFNPETWIPYQLSKPTDVTLTIYDIKGRVVRVLDLGHQRAGLYKTRSRAAYWDGRNAVGEKVASGLYFYTLTAGDFSATRKMLIRK